MSNARGIRNNNPGNIRKDGSVWRGEVAGPDKNFKTFETMAWGIRAIYHLLNNYCLLYGCDTIEKMIRRWAPPEDGNDTESYISTVSNLSAHQPPDDNRSFGDGAYRARDAPG